MAGILREQQPTVCPRVRGREGDCNVPIRCMGELDLERSASCQGGEHQPLSSAHEGRAALSAVKLQFGLALDTCRGLVTQGVASPCLRQQLFSRTDPALLAASQLGLLGGIVGGSGVGVSVLVANWEICSAVLSRVRIPADGNGNFSPGTKAQQRQ
ncbi:hypothetical protein Anapl_12021 [Anas platyrhynchos]|uniref:Uncharacterized protein n=1 Tax=Anas platyrhynchos TaxID=8839 RepID=R0LR85_ANAPL|nr:hypothetical protein Anapl_12021 [Anas platyrhynchos]